MPGCYVVFHKQLGDLLLLEPALRRLQAHHGAEIAVCTRGGHAPMLDLMPGMKLQWGPMLQPRTHLYCFDTLNKSAWRSLFAPTRSKICIIPDAEELAWFHPWLFGDVVVPGLGDSYVAEYFWENTPVPTTAGFRAPRLTLPPAEWKPAEAPDSPFILLNPTSGWRRKSWVSAGWAEVVRALHAAGLPPIIMTSATNDWQLAQCGEIEALSAPLVRGFTTPTTLQNYLWLCANASMVLSVDGSAAHLAAAFEVPNLTLFGPSNPRNWHCPTATSVALRAPSLEDGKHKMRLLPPSAVTSAALDLWKRSR